MKKPDIALVADPENTPATYWLNPAGTCSKVAVYVELTRLAELLSAGSKRTFTRDEVATLLRTFRDEICR